MYHVHGHVVELCNLCIFIQVVWVGVVRLWIRLIWRERKDQMYTPEDIARVEEFVWSGIFTICESNTMKATGLKAALMIQIASKPMDPEELHAVWLNMPQASYIDMEDPEDLGIPVWVQCYTIFFVFVS